MSEKISCTSAETCKPSLKKAIFGAVLAGGGLYGTVYGAIDANGPISGQTGTTLYEQNARVTVEEVSRVAGSEAYADGIIAGLGFGGIIAGCLLLAREENTRAKRAMEKRGTKSE